jgi:Tol biopolymer transport system component
MLLAIAASPAQATFPGPNGKIAFTSERNGDPDIWVMNPDGSGQVGLTGQGTDDRSPAWAPHGRDIAFTQGGALFAMDAEGGSVRRVTPESVYAGLPAWSPDGESLAYADFAIYVIDASGDGTPRAISNVNPPESHASPDWSPGGETIAFSRGAAYGDRYSSGQYSTLTLVDPAGTTETPLTNDTAWIDTAPSFSPDGETIVFARQPNPCCGTLLADLYTIPVGGGTPTQLTDTPDVREGQPVWSPDGTRIAFAAHAEGNTDIYVMNADGTGRQRLTTALGADSEPSWRGSLQPAPGFPRPKSARTIRVPLVPAYAECTEPNRTHGPPLAFGSCNPPQSSTALDGTRQATFGTPDANGHPAQSTGYVRFTTVAGDPSTVEDEADVRISLHVTDVRKADYPSTAYPFNLALPLPLRLTDKQSGCCGVAGTVRDFDQHIDYQLQVEATCVASGSGVGATCSVTTTADTILPGFVSERSRSVWQFAGPVKVYDSGADAWAASAYDNAPLATQGLFVP